MFCAVLCVLKYVRVFVLLKGRIIKSTTAMLLNNRFLCPSGCFLIPLLAVFFKLFYWYPHKTNMELLFDLSSVTAADAPTLFQKV